MSLTYVTSEENKLKSDYTYVKHKTNGNKVFGKCDKSRSYKCHVRLHTKNNNAAAMILISNSIL